MLQPWGWGAGWGTVPPSLLFCCYCLTCALRALSSPPSTHNRSLRWRLLPLVAR